MTTEFDGKKHGAIIAIPFTLTNATTGLSNGDLVFAGGVGTLFVAPGAGSVVGISARAGAALTGGTITLKPQAAGSEFTASGTPTPVLTTGAQTTYATARPGALTFAAGATLGISATATTTLQPTNTLDVDATLFVQLAA